MFWECDLISNGDPTPKPPKMLKELRGKERAEGRRKGGVEAAYRRELRESERNRRGKEKEVREWGESVFILMCTQSEGSVSAIVPGLPVKTVWLLQRLFI